MSATVFSFTTGAPLPAPRDGRRMEALEEARQYTRRSVELLQALGIDLDVILFGMSLGMEDASRSKLGQSLLETFSEERSTAMAQELWPAGPKGAA